MLVWQNGSNGVKDNDAILMFDSAYEASSSTEDTAKSIYEIEGAREVAIESVPSKLQVSTGTRCAYAVVNLKGGHWQN